jgi:PAS domain-containing protein
MSNSSFAKLPQEAQPSALVEDEGLRFDSVLAFDRRELNDLRDIWKHKAKVRGFATRADFDARTLKPYMRNITILDVVPQEDGSRRYRYRFFGTSIVQVFGEQTGHFIEEFIPPDKMARWTAGHDLVVLSGRPLRFKINYNSPHINYLSSESLVMPLGDESGTVVMLMCCLYFGPKRI